MRAGRSVSSSGPAFHAAWLSASRFVQAEVETAYRKLGDKMGQQRVKSWPEWGAMQVRPHTQEG